MRTRWWIVVTALVILSGAVVATGGIGGATATEGGVAATPADAGVDRSAADAQVGTDRVVLQVSVDAGGDATWEVQYWTELAGDPDRTAAFEDLQDDVEADPGNYTDRFANRMRTTVGDAQEATGREMNASGFAVETETVAVPCDCGVVTYTFEWSNFASVEGDRIAVGDAIGGFFLDDGSRLEIQWPGEWSATTVDPAPDSESDRSVTWRGSATDFGPGQPRVVIEPGGATPTGTPTPTETPTGTPTESPGAGQTPDESPTPAPGDGESGLPLTALAVLALVAVGVGLAWWRRPGDATLPGGGDGGSVTGREVGSRNDSGDGGSATADVAGGPSAVDGDGDPVIDEELLSNEERVLRLLEEHGGRIKQQEVVDALDWTEAKTSQVVSGMRDDDTIDGFRLGRENVLTLPDTEIEPDSADDGGGEE